MLYTPTSHGNRSALLPRKDMASLPRKDVAHSHRNGSARLFEHKLLVSLTEQYCQEEDHHQQYSQKYLEDHLKTIRNILQDVNFLLIIMKGNKISNI